jgi:hypothetical protein
VDYFDPWVSWERGYGWEVTFVSVDDERRTAAQVAGSKNLTNHDRSHFGSSLRKFSKTLSTLVCCCCHVGLLGQEKLRS